MNKRQREKARKQIGKGWRREAQATWDRMPRLTNFGFPPHGTCLTYCHCGSR